MTAKNGLYGPFLVGFLGAHSPENFLNLESWKCNFQHSVHQKGALVIDIIDQINKVLTDASGRPCKRW